MLLVWKISVANDGYGVAALGMVMLGAGCAQGEERVSDDVGGIPFSSLAVPSEVRAGTDITRHSYAGVRCGAESIAGAGSSKDGPGADKEEPACPSLHLEIELPPSRTATPAALGRNPNRGGG